MTENKKEYTNLRVPANVKQLCEDFVAIADMQGKKLSVTMAFESIFKDALTNVEPLMKKIAVSTKELETIRQETIAKNKAVLADLGDI